MKFKSQLYWCVLNDSTTSGPSNKVATWMQTLTNFNLVCVQKLSNDLCVLTYEAKRHIRLHNKLTK